MHSEIADIADEDLKKVNGGFPSVWDIVDVLLPGVGTLGHELTNTLGAGDFSQADLTAIENGAWGTGVLNPPGSGDIRGGAEGSGGDGSLDGTDGSGGIGGF
jgi:hypothetical protein